jgi:hypothetical protein
MDMHGAIVPLLDGFSAYAVLQSYRCTPFRKCTAKIGRKRQWRRTVYMDGVCGYMKGIGCMSQVVAPVAIIRTSD